MVLVNDNLKLEHRNLYKANFLYIECEKRQLPDNKYGYNISTVEFDNGEKYHVVVQSCELAFKSWQGDVWSLINGEDSPSMDYETLKEYFINGIQTQLRFEHESYIRLINEKNPDKIKYVFNDYYEALEYLEQIEGQE